MLPPRQESDKKGRPPPDPEDVPRRRGDFGDKESRERKGEDKRKGGGEGEGERVGVVVVERRARG